MPAKEDPFKTEIQQLVQQGSQILQRAQVLPREMAGEELADATAWVTRLGRLVTSVYGEKSQHAATYSKALATEDFYSLHSNWNGHFAQLVGLAKSIAHDFDRGLAPQKPPSNEPITLTDEHGLWWFFHHCTTKIRGWLIAKAVAILVALAVAAYFAGRSHFFSQVIDLWKKNSTP